MNSHYEILVQGQIKREWQEWFESMEFIYLQDRLMIIAGELTDQTSLLGILAKADDLGMKIINVRQIELKR